MRILCDDVFSGDSNIWCSLEQGATGLDEFLWVSDTHIKEQPFLASCDYIGRVANECGNFVGT